MILPLLNHKEKNVLGPWMPGYIVCQRICQLKNQLISSSYSSRGYKNRIFYGFWNVGYTLFLKEENWNWLFSFLKEKKKKKHFEALMFFCRPQDVWLQYLCARVHARTPRAYLHTLMQRWFIIELMPMFSSPRQLMISFLPWSDGWFEQLGRARARKALIYLLLNWFRRMQEDDTSLN